MKKIIVSASILLLSIGLQAQEAEIKATISAANSKDYKTALSQAQKAETLLASNHSIEPEKIAEFYQTAGKAAQATNDLGTAAGFFAKMQEIESVPYYYAKNKDTKEVEYYYDKSAAEKAVAAGNYTKLKEAKLDGKYTAEVAPQLQQLYQTSINKANSSFKSKDYAVAGNRFLESYNIGKALGNANNLVKYYAGISFLQDDNNIGKSATILQELVDDKFTGVETIYSATEKESGEVKTFGSKESMDTQVKLGLFTNPKTEKTKSLEEDLYNNLAFAYFKGKDWDNGIKIGEEGLKKFPDNKNMSDLLNGMYLKSGRSDEFVQGLKDKIASGDATAQDYFNLAKTIEDANGDVNEAKSYYEKAIEVDPEFKNAYINLAYLILKDEKTYVKLINANLGDSPKEKKIYTENVENRKKLYEIALPYLEKAYEIESDDASLIKILKNTYEVVGNDDKYFEFKKRYESLR